MASKRQYSPVALIMQRGLAFGTYLQDGIEAVKKYYPLAVDFVLEHSDKSLKAVNNIITAQLNAEKAASGDSKLATVHTSQMAPLAQ